MIENAITVVIIDDDRSSAEILRRSLENYEWVSECVICSGLDDGRNTLERLSPELLFLDIELNGESGLEIARELNERAGNGLRIVFYTSYRKYLIQALRLQAFDFLLKPFDPEELAIMMRRFLMQTSREAECVRLQSQTVPPTDHQAISITTITNDRIIVSPRNIVFFRYDSDRKIWEVMLDSFQRLILKRHTTAETILNYGSKFVRTHKTYIVNISYLSMICSSGCLLVEPFDKLPPLKISKNYRRQLLDRFYDL